MPISPGSQKDPLQFPLSWAEFFLNIWTLPARVTSSHMTRSDLQMFVHTYGRTRPHITFRYMRQQYIILYSILFSLSLSYSLQMLIPRSLICLHVAISSKHGMLWYTEAILYVGLPITTSISWYCAFVFVGLDAKTIAIPYKQ